MKYQDLFFEYLKKVEEQSAKIDEWDRWAKEQVQRKHGHRLARTRDPIERDNLEALYLKEILVDHPRYGKMTGTRNFTMNMAELYGTAALLEEVINDDPDTVGSENSAGRGGNHRPSPTGRSQHRDQAA